MSNDPEQITFFAKTDARGQEISFGIKAKDRTRHVYVIGKTGMGKSTLLENMAIQDIENGNGIAFIDPHGQTAETLLDYIPEERKKDVLYFAPFDTDYPVSFNVMEDVGPDRRHLVVSGLMSVFKKIWVDAWSARMEYILSNTLLALLEYPDSTLLGVNRMLSDKGYRKKVVENITDPAVRSFWVDEFANYNERYMQEAGDAIKNKIGQFTSNPLIRNIVGQPKSSFDIREIMDDKKILIMNLSKGLVGEQNANLLGSMLTTRIYLAAMSRANLSNLELQKAPNFYFYVDEFQSFANATFADILSEARKYKLNLTIAHQYIEQMEEEVRNAVFGNVGTIIAFRVGPFDAEVLESIFTPKFLAPDIVNLGFAQVYLTLMIDGIGSQPFSATTLPPIASPEVSFKEIVVNMSRKQFAHPRSGVEAVINAWHSAKDIPGKPNDTKNGANGAKRDYKKPLQSSNSFVRKESPTNRSVSNASSARIINNDSEKKESQPRREYKRSDTVSQNRTSEGNRNVQRTNDSEKPAQSIRQERSDDPRKNEKRLEDLRSILKNLTKNDAVTQKSDKPEQPRRPEQRTPRDARDTQKTIPKKDIEAVVAPTSTSTPASTPMRTPAQEAAIPKKSEPTLKDALAQALGGVEVATLNNQKADNQSVEKESEKVERNDKIKTPVLTEKPYSKPQPQPQPQSKPKPAAQQERQAPLKEDPLSPKKLERMMRITGNDRTPLK